MKRVLPVIGVVLLFWAFATGIILVLGTNTIIETAYVIWPTATLLLPAFTVMMDVAVSFMSKEEDR